MSDPTVSVLDSALAVILDSIGDVPPLEHALTAEFPALDTLSDALRKSRETFDLHIRTIEAKINRRRNALLPIHQLPVEILAEIFRRTNARDLEMGERHNLAQVCSTWLQIVLSSPRLWTRFQTSCGSWPLVLRKSFNLPLTIHLDSHYSDLDTEAWDQAARQRHRWKGALVMFLSVDCVGRYNRFWNAAEIPLLESIRFIGNAGMDSELANCIIPLAPNLKIITTRGVLFHWPVMPLQPKLLDIQMFHLSLSSSQLFNFIAMLAACPLLEDLSFQSVHVLDEVIFANDHATTGSLVALPNLARLHVENSPTLLVRLLWDVKAGDALRRVKIIERKPLNFHQFIGLHFSHQSPVSILRKALQQYRSVRMYVNPARLSFALYLDKDPASNPIFIGLTTSGPPQLAGLLEVFNQNPGPVFTVRVRDYPAEPAAIVAQASWSSILYSMALVQTLVLEARHCTSWLHLLSPNLGPSFDGGPWVLPTLRHLILELGDETETAEELAEIANLLATRRSHREAQETPVSEEMEVWDRKGRRFNIIEGRFGRCNPDEVPAWWNTV